MKVLGLMGSPRRKGNTERLLESFMQGAREAGADTETLILKDYTYSPCLEIYACRKDGRCVLKDDMEKIAPLLEGCDMLVVASPMFFYALPAHLKALIDRCQASWVRKYEIDKRVGHERLRPGIFLAVGATGGKNLFKGSVFTVRYFFDALDVRYEAELLVRGLDFRDDILRHPTALADGESLGRRLVEKYRNTPLH